jgi:hypothetical protein
MQNARFHISCPDFCPSYRIASPKTVTEAPDVADMDAGRPALVVGMGSVRRGDRGKLDTSQLASSQSAPGHGLQQIKLKRRWYKIALQRLAKKAMKA